MTNFDKDLFHSGFARVVCALGLLLVFLCGCKTTEYVPVETVRTEYRDRVNTESVVDSIVDNHYVYIKGDTVIDWRDRVKWKDREVHDSIYINKTDTIRVPYPVEKVKVEKQLAWWQTGLMWIGGIGLALLGWLMYRKASRRL